MRSIMHFSISSTNLITKFSKVSIGWKHEYGDCLDCHTCNYFGLHTNVKFKAIFKINIVKILIIHVVINVNENHHKKIGWILRRLWTHNGHLKWQPYVDYIEKMKNVESKKCQSSVKIKIK